MRNSGSNQAHLPRKSSVGNRLEVLFQPTILVPRLLSEIGSVPNVKNFLDRNFLAGLLGGLLGRASRGQPGFAGSAGLRGVSRASRGHRASRGQTWFSVFSVVDSQEIRSSWSCHASQATCSVSRCDLSHCHTR